MAKVKFTRHAVQVVTIALSWALGMTLVEAFKRADFEDVEKEAAQPKPSEMKEFSGHGQAVSDNKDDSTRQAQNREMVESASDSEMLG